MKKFLLLFILCNGIFLSSCSRQVFLLKHQGGNLGSLKASNFFLGGILQEDYIDTTRICGHGSKVALVESSMAPLDVLISFGTLGIYTPRETRVYCTGRKTRASTPTSYKKRLEKSLR